MAGRCGNAVLCCALLCSAVRLGAPPWVTPRPSWGDSCPLVHVCAAPRGICTPHHLPPSTPTYLPAPADEGVWVDVASTDVMTLAGLLAAAAQPQARQQAGEGVGGPLPPGGGVGPFSPWRRRLKPPQCCLLVLLLLLPRAGANRSTICFTILTTATPHLPCPAPQTRHAARSAAAAMWGTGGWRRCRDTSWEGSGAAARGPTATATSLHPPRRSWQAACTCASRGWLWSRRHCRRRC